MSWLWIGGATAAAVFLISLVLGARSALGYDDRAVQSLFALLKGEYRGPRWVERVPFVVWIPVIVVVHLLVLLPLFVGGWAVWAGGWCPDEQGRPAGEPPGGTG